MRTRSSSKPLSKQSLKPKRNKAFKMTVNAEDLLVRKKKKILEEEVLRIEKEGQGRVGKILKMNKFMTG